MVDAEHVSGGQILSDSQPEPALAFTQPSALSKIPPGSTSRTDVRVERRIAAIMAADVVGYSRLMEQDEAGTLVRLKSLHNAIVQPIISKHSGRLFKRMGDGILVEFANASDAVQCAVALQTTLAERQAEIPQGERLIFRIGVNQDQVIVDADDVYGDAVNVAARLEGMADPGGILVSQTVHDAVVDDPACIFFDNGKRKFKNISRPIRVWSWPRQLPSLRAQGKPRFSGNSADEVRTGADLGDALKAHFARLTGLEVAADRAQAHYVVEGTARIASGRARNLARLVAVDADRQLWSERYDENIDDYFEIVDRCVPRMAMSVRRRVAAEDAARLANRPIDELSLEELLAYAGVSFFTPTKAGWHGGGEIAEYALELDPKNFMGLAMAAAGLGLADFMYDVREPEQAVTELAFKRTEEALRINARSDMLNVAHALLLLHVRKRHRDATAAARRSLEFNPEYNMGLWVLGAAQIFAGDFEAGTPNALRAVNIDIRDPYVHLYSRVVAYGHLGAGRYDDAVDWFQRADQLAPGVPPNLLGLIASQQLAGDKEGARDAVSRLLEQRPALRLSDMHPLPYREQARWIDFVETLRRAGMAE
jgi:adenylate cyclase